MLAILVLALVFKRLLRNPLRLIGFGGRDLLDLAQSFLRVPTYLLHLRANLLGDADGLLLGETAELTLHLDDRLARLSRCVQHLLGARAEEA
ncbi:MAG TPA: hypothetical protein VJ891_16045, partial [Casimicrobiaceae bacterium]|nr:hypothetical protein [Casimicrobiaceae bacterium]